MNPKLFMLMGIFCLVVSCSDTNPQPSTGTVSFQLGSSGASKSMLSKSTLTAPNKVSIVEAKTIIISIENMDGQTTVDTKQLNLYNMDGSFISEPIPLNTGQYKLTKYLVLDGYNNIIYATPVTGSAKAYLVQNPLPISFSVNKDQVTTITPEIVDATNGSSSDFGYVTFTFNVVPTFNFMVAAFVSNNGTFVATDVLITVTSNGSTLYSGNLSAVTNTIQIKDVITDYTVIVTKSGYKDNSTILTNNQMKDCGTTPLVIVMEAL